MADRPLRLAPILLEAGFVVLGVFLALVANEWRADANDRAHARSARATIVEEIRTNRDAVEHMRAYHEHLLDTLHALPPDAPPPSPRLFNAGFASAATTLSTAWEAANATDAVSYMDFEDVLAFSELYALQRRYEQTAEEVGEVVFGAIYERGTDGVAENHRNLAHLNGALLYREHELLDAYDAVLSRMAPVD